MAQLVRALAAPLTENRVLFPAPTWWFIIIPNSSTRDPTPSSGTRHACSTQHSYRQPTIRAEGTQVPEPLKYSKL